MYESPDMQTFSIESDVTTLSHHRPGSDKGQGGDTGITIPDPGGDLPF